MNSQSLVLNMPILSFKYILYLLRTRKSLAQFRFAQSNDWKLFFFHPKPVRGAQFCTVSFFRNILSSVTVAETRVAEVFFSCCPLFESESYRIGSVSGQPVFFILSLHGIVFRVSSSKVIVYSIYILLCSIINRLLFFNGW